MKEALQKKQELRAGLEQMDEEEFKAWEAKYEVKRGAARDGTIRKYPLLRLSEEGVRKLENIAESEPETLREYLDNESPDCLDTVIKLIEKTRIEELRLIMAGLLDEREEE